MTQLVAILALAGCATLAAEARGEASGAPARPNILFFLADDLGYGDLGCYGHPRLRTPHIDRLAREGTRFLQFYVQSTCSPTRAALITGQDPSRWRIDGPITTFANNARRRMPNWLDVTAPSLPRVLQQAGYRTAHLGKWHLGGGSGSVRNGKVAINHPHAPPVSAYGFEVVRADFGNGPTWRAAEPVPEPHDLYPYNEPEWQTWSSRAVADAAIAFLDDHARRDRARPFYAQVWFKDPHTPLRPTEEMRAAYRDLPEPLQTHCAMVTFMDEQIGRVLATLARHGLEERTLVIFTSDNGALEFLGGSNGALRDWKWYLFEGGIRVPFILRWPVAGGVPQGRVDTTSALNILDFMPTLARLAGAQLPDSYRPDGVDATDAWLGRMWQRRAPMHWFHPARYLPHQALAIRDGDWKLLMDPDGANLALYDVVRDAEEKHDRSAENPRIAARLRAQLEAWYATLPVPRPSLATHGRPKPPRKQ